MSHDRKRQGCAIEKGYKNNIINFSVLSVNNCSSLDLLPSRLQQQYSSHLNNESKNGKFHHDVHNKFHSWWYFPQRSSQTVCVYMDFIMFHVEAISSCFDTLNGEKEKEKKSLNSLYFIFILDAFWFIIKEEKLNNSELIKWFKALISFMFLRPFSSSPPNASLSIHSNYGEVS